MKKYIVIILLSVSALISCQEKVEYVLQHDSALQGYHTSDMAEMNRNESVFFSKKNVGGKKFDGDYQGLRTEEKIRHIKG